MNRILKLVIQHTQFMARVLALRRATCWEVYQSFSQLNFVLGATAALRAVYHVALILTQGQPGVPISPKFVRIMIDTAYYLHHVRPYLHLSTRINASTTDFRAI
jgi:hypothetical protein